MRSESGTRSEPFGYVCNRCLRCCRSKMIQVDPYEIARLARRLGQTTAEFRIAYTENGQGNHLRHEDDGACVFLGAQGCTVYSDRPLVCRIYPLGRYVGADGTEHWSHVEPHPQTEGVYTHERTIGDFIEASGAEPFMLATDRYTAWVRRAITVMALPPDSIRDDIACDVDESTYDVIDMDTAIATYCMTAGIAEPEGLEARTDLHLQILHERLSAIEGGDDE